jgi:hypothetical protein
MLGIADQLKDGPKSYEIVAEACGAHPTSLYRLLRALAAIGVFREVWQHASMGSNGPLAVVECRLLRVDVQPRGGAVPNAITALSDHGR